MKSMSGFLIFKDRGQSKKWYYQRKYRITGSAIAGVLGRSPFSNVSKTVLQMLGVYQTPVNPAMSHGVEYEPVARKWYEKEYKVKVLEAGFALSLENIYLGVSVDGCVDTDGIIEIKCPQKMYYQLEMYVPSDIKLDKKKSLYHQVYSHIFETHYLQMQLGMYILKRTWCDYVVYTTNKKFVQKVLYDPVYFEQVLQELEENFYERYQLLLDQINIKLYFSETPSTGSIIEKTQTIHLVHELFQNECTCDESSETVLECCLRH